MSEVKPWIEAAFLKKSGRAGNSDVLGQGFELDTNLWLQRLEKYDAKRLLSPAVLM